MATNEIYYENLDALIEKCISSYNENGQHLASKQSNRSRQQLARFSELFHNQSHTLSRLVQERINQLKSDNCIVIMTAHQPNFFPYDGVMRKATLAYVLAKRIEQELKLPVINIFGIADQDFGTDRWIKTMSLPDPERRDGILELRLTVPEKRMLNRIKKPSESTLNFLKKEIESWVNKELNLIKQAKDIAALSNEQEAKIRENLRKLWKIIDEANSSSAVLSDFNAFVMSKIVNEIWGYDTLFFRFSECQQFFLDEFSFLLSNFDDYSDALKQVVSSTHALNGIPETEWNLAPFWYHCDCGSKVRLEVIKQSDHYYGIGNCILCDKRQEFDFGIIGQANIETIISKISARSISMPLVILNGLGVSCYIGGQGGKDYLLQANEVAKILDIYFPPIVVWRPKDQYRGLGQLSSLVIIKRIVGSANQHEIDNAKTDLETKIQKINSQIDTLEEKKKEILKTSKDASKPLLYIDIIRELSYRQNEIRKNEKYPEIVRNLSLLNNALAALALHPSIVDYALSIGLKETSDQWVNSLQTTEGWTKGCQMKTIITYVNDQ